MLKCVVLFIATLALVLGLVVMGVSKATASLAGSWQVDTRHSDAQLITDATTYYGKTKLDVTLGFGRINGEVAFNDNDPTKSTVDLFIYPATVMLPPIAEEGKFSRLWLSNVANHTLMCFHSEQVTRTTDGRLQATGTLVLTQVDRSIQADPNEGYAGPVYGPPIIHRVSHKGVTLLFDSPAADGSTQKDGLMQVSASTKVVREDFPQLLKAVTATYWPPVVQDEACRALTVGEDYHGIPCTGTMLEAPSLPEPPHAANAEDIGSGEASSFNAIVGEHLNIVLHMRLLAKNQHSPR